MVFINLLEKMKVKEEYKYLTNFKWMMGFRRYILKLNLVAEILVAIFCFIALINCQSLMKFGNFY